MGSVKADEGQNACCGHEGVSAMKIIECSPFFNENLIAGIKIEEGKNWIDELHVAECDKTFRYRDKTYSFAHADEPIVHYQKIQGESVFVSSRWGLTRKPWFVKLKSYPWQNETIQRNLACSQMEYSDSDIIILSDIDEIIDSRLADRIVHEVKKRGMVTVKFHFSLFFFNLFSRNWPGPPDYSYRTFVMTGKRFRELTLTSDQLRKAGEHGELQKEVHCIEEIAGFHHSWLGNEDFIAEKLRAYAHAPEDHGKGLFDGDAVNMDYLRECIAQKKSIFGPEHELYVDNDKEFLRSVTRLRDTEYKKFFL
jgi:Glycosyltransferase family 17